MYKYIIWDFDGTLFDTYPVMAESFKKALEGMGIEESTEHIMELMKVSGAHLMKYCRERYKVDENIKQSYDYLRKEVEFERVKPFPNIKKVCESIYHSNGQNYLYTHRGRSAIELLKRHDLYDYFSDFITKEDNFKRKPDPEALLYLMDKNDIRKESALMIGDRDIDLQAGKNAGIDTCYFMEFEPRVNQFADYSIVGFEELLSIIGL